VLMLQRNLKALLLLTALFASAMPASARTDWPQWRGPNRDGMVADFAVPQTWPQSLKEQWRVTVGVGHASPLLVEGRVYVFARQGDEEVLLALDAMSGKEIWRAAGERVPYEMNPAASGHGKGPKSTPVYSQGKIFTLGITGILSAHDARTGKLRWRKEFSKQYPTTSPLYGTAMSPLVDNGLVIAHVGGHDRGALMAFDAETGAVKWSYDADGPAYASPIIVTQAGVRQIVTFTQKEFVGVSMASGKLLWKLPAKTSYDTNSVTGLAYKEMLIFAREGQGLTAIRLAKQGEQLVPQEVWNNKENELYMNSPVLQGNLLFGLSVRKKGQLFCIDADTGKTLWQGPGRMGENAALLNTGKVLLVLTNDAKLVVVEPSATAYKTVAEYTVAQSQTWAHPVLLRNRIFVKDETTLASLAVS
jgi:outer membrane protein assembly factor BamB